ncbi:MAG: bifunctional riboflavin kinase/FAD synthetase [bacterium]
MKIYNINDLNFNFQNSVLTIGSFDGIHLGHVKLMELAKESAAKLNSKSIVLTFYPHPMKALRPESKIHLITTFEKKVELIAKLGIDYLIYIPFSKEFAKMPPETFIKKIIYEKLKPLKIIIGQDFGFGNGKTGNIEVLGRYSKEFGFELSVISPVKIGDDIISSTLIRQLILKGEISKVKTYLGRYYSVRGKVVKGSSRGKSIGFPTANIIPEEELFPKDGVYASFVKINGVNYKAITNIGSNPTFNDDLRRIESLIFNFSGDIYDNEIEVYFVERLRDEIKFDSVNALQEKIKEDIELTECIFQLEKQ